MAVGFQAVSWNRFKAVYDAVLWIGALGFTAVFAVSAVISQPPGESFHPVQLVLRASAGSAFALLTLALAIGPLARLSPRFTPLLYNRRHLGVTVFLFALAHAALAILWYHGFSDTNAFVSLISTNANYDRIGGFPFESLGLIAFLVLFAMAATSHDFWLELLGAPVWKMLHMLVYPAYVLIVAHVALGAMQDQTSPLFPGLLAVSGAGLLALHGAAALKERADDRREPLGLEDGWISAGDPHDIPDGRAVIVSAPGGERIAVFRDGATIGAVTNVCKHQNGPLGEGKIRDGCVVCPWHGWEYRLADGVAPAPFNERIATHDVRLDAGAVWVKAAGNPPGTPRPLVRLNGDH